MTIGGDGTKTVSSSGTAVALGTSATKCVYIVVQAQSGNVGSVYVGTSTVTKTGKRGIELPAGQSTGIPAGDLDDVYVDADNSNDKVSFVYFIE